MTEVITNPDTIVTTMGIVDIGVIITDLTTMVMEGITTNLVIMVTDEGTVTATGIITVIDEDMVDIIDAIMVMDEGMEGMVATKNMNRN